MSDFITVRLPESERARFRAWIYKQKAENIAECRRLITEIAHKTARRAKMFAPVDKGYLRGSIRVDISHNGMGARIYVGREYGPYVEFGTGTGVVAPDDVKDYAMTFKGRGLRKVNNRAQPYLFPAMRLANDEMMMKLKNMGFK